MKVSMVRALAGAITICVLASLPSAATAQEGKTMVQEYVNTHGATFGDVAQDFDTDRAPQPVNSAHEPDGDTLVGGRGHVWLDDLQRDGLAFASRDDLEQRT